MSRWMQCSLTILSLGLAVSLAAQSPASKAAEGSAESPALRSENARDESRRDEASETGAIVGKVVDRQGAAQVGVAVTILRQDGRYIERVYTQRDGRFRLDNLTPGLYAAEIAQPSFLPFWKSAIALEAGAELLLNINLVSLADSVEIGLPESLRSAMGDWKWALRTSYPGRPILHFEPDSHASAASSMQDPRERALRGTVQFVAGNQSDGFGQDPALQTAFDMAYAVASSQQIGLAGSAGWEHGTPAASMRAAWNRSAGEMGSSTLSMTVRQVFLPSEYWIQSGSLPGRSDRRVQSLTLGYEEEKMLNERLRLQMGSLYDTLSFGRQMTRWSPFGRLTYLPSESSRLTVAYTAANPNILPSEGETARRPVNSVLAIPQISSDGSGRPVLEGGRHMEVQWEQQWGARVRLQAAAFYTALSHTAVSLALNEPDEFAEGLLRDPFSNRYFLSGGASASPGTRFAVGARISPHTELIVGYSYAGTVQAPAAELNVADAAELRTLLGSQSGGSVSVKLDSRLPLTNTRLITSYRWLPGEAVVVTDSYHHGWSHSEPFLNLYILQPIPSPELLHGELEAVADFNNLLAQGYLTLRSPGGTNGTIFPSARSFRGGVNFIF